MSDWITREELHFAYGAFFLELGWWFFHLMGRLDSKGRLPRWLRWLAIRSTYHFLYFKSCLAIIIGALIRELWDLTWGNNPPWKSWVDVWFWLLGIGVMWFYGYRKWHYIVERTK